METPLKKTAIFWDYENVPFKAGNLTNFLNDIEEIKKLLGQGSFFRCFGDWKTVPVATQTEIQQAGFELIQVPQTRKNAADSVLTINAIDVYHQSQYEDFYLISSDGDFAALLMNLKTKKITISIIARRKTVSNDLKEYCSEFFYVTSKGNLFKYELKEREALIEMLEVSMEDAQLAFDNLIQRSLDRDVEIFSYGEWQESYLSLEDYKISPIILNQVIEFKDLFKLFIKHRRYGNDSNYDFICKHSSGEKREIGNLELDVQIPNAKNISVPIRPLPKTGLKELISEFMTSQISEESSSEEELKGKEINTPSSDTLKGGLDKNKYLKTIAQVFRNMSSGKKSGEIKMTNLNTKVCEALDISTGNKIYKTFDFKQFSKAVEATKGQFGKKVTMKKDTLKF